MTSLTATKTADGLIDPKLVLAWLLNTLGAPGYLIGLLVPVREAGALLPQLLIARQIERSTRRKYFWSAGAAGQGLASLGMAAAAVMLSDAAAGWSIVICLAFLAVARSACSASHKDVLARTVEKGQRGRVSGAAGTLSAVAVLAFALGLATGVIPRSPSVVATAIAVAGLLWLCAAAIFSMLREKADRDADADDRSLHSLLQPLQEDAELRTYIATRALLISTALAPPFLVLLGSGDTDTFGNLGLLMLASSFAAILSSYIWGVFADSSSRKTLMVAGVIATATFALAAILAFSRGTITNGFVLAGLVFIAQLAYHGARAGRKTHLTDMDTGGRKATYTALSNSVIGLLLLTGGLLGLLADLAGAKTVLAVLAILSGLSVGVAYRLSEVQSEDTA
ncbi:MFS transporter [Roseovarius sp. CAU 1744]|uniref:MFS transporter n=1 Tax=Roseovarius sp. CAU 1744 TaxID=3140368 RepID=UPI00325A670B